MTPLWDEDLLIEPNDSPTLAMEIEPEPSSPAAPDAIEPDPPAAVAETALVPMPLAEILDANFPLPRLIKFCPNPKLKQAAGEATAHLLSIDVIGAEGLQHADVGLTVLRGAQKAIEASFEDPAGLAFELHRNITSKRAEWLAPGKTAIDTVGKRVYAEQRRLDAIAAEERRKAQEEANRIAREQLRQEAAAAAKNQAPPQVVEELQKRAETAVAPPVATPAAAPPMKGTSTVERWKARIVGSPADADPNPDVLHLTPAQTAKVLDLLRAIVDRKAPLACIELAWPYLNRRAGAEKSTLAIPSIEAYDDGGVRAKSSRSRS